MRLDTEDELFGKWPPKKLIGSFWLLLSEVHEQAAAEIYQQVYFSYGRDIVRLRPHLHFFVAGSSGFGHPQTWNPFR